MNAQQYHVIQRGQNYRTGEVETHYLTDDQLNWTDHPEHFSLRLSRADAARLSRELNRWRKERNRPYLPAGAFGIRPADVVHPWLMSDGTTFLLTDDQAWRLRSLRVICTTDPAPWGNAPPCASSRFNQRRN